MRSEVLGGRYRILEKIGEGGMAYVYLALDEKLGRKVAIKVLHEHMQSNPDIRRRFQLEAQAISSLDHPNIVKIYDFSGDAQQRLWIVTEVIHGDNLAQFVQKFQGGWLHPVIATCIVREACKALQVAHNQGIVHRDIKPENIMITRQGMIKLMDFGISKDLGRSNVTVTGTFMGSPSYMSPEQIRGRDIDHRSDIYSLSVLFYEILTGRLPFTGQTTHDVVLRIMEGKYTHPRFLVPNLSEKLDSLIIRGITKDKTVRVATVAEYAEQLDAFLQSMGLGDSATELEKYFRDPKGFDRKLNQLEGGFKRKSRTLRKTIRSIHLPKPIGQAKTTAPRSQLPQFVGNFQPTKRARSLPPSAIPKPKRRTAITFDPVLPPVAEPIIPVRPEPAPTAARVRPRLPRRTIRPRRVSRPGTELSAATKAFGVALVAAFAGLLIWGFVELQQSIGSQSPNSRTAKVDGPPLPSPVPQKPAVQKQPRKVAVKPTPAVQPTAAAVERMPERVVEKVEPRSTTRPRVIVNAPTERPSPSPAMERPTPRNEQRREDQKRKIAETATTKILTKPSTEPRQIVESKEPTPRPIIKASDTDQKRSNDQGIYISSSPAAEIYIDGKRSGTTNDSGGSSKWLHLTEGKHLVLLKRQGYQTYRELINLDAGEKISLTNIELKPAADFALKLVAKPTPVQVSVRNLDTDTTQVFTMTTANRTLSLERGRYSVKISYKGAIKERVIEPQDGQNALTFSAEFATEKVDEEEDE
jgi:serine/threonine protein kinase